MRNFPLCTILIALLAIQPVYAQEIATIPLVPPPMTAPSSAGDALEAGTPIRFVLLDSVSSAIAVKGQKVRFAVADDVLVNGIVAIPRGTPAEGVVAHVRKGIPDKQDGELEVQPRKILLSGGRKLKLIRTGEDCDISIPGCWVFVPVVVAGIAILGPIALGAEAVNAVKHTRRRRVLTPIHPKIEGTDISRKPCETDTAVTVYKWKFSTAQAQPSGSATETTVKILDACAAHGKG